MRRIEPVIRDYAWGSRESLAKLAGRPTPTSEPEAELWVGAHEAGAAHVPQEQCTLDQHIAADLEHSLGSVAENFEGRLPFLLKILAAEKALSIQAHPDAMRAASAPEGTYGDHWPKPEAWVPLEECEAFIGSLPFDEAAARLRRLELGDLTELVDVCESAADPALALLAGLLHWPAREQGSLVERVVAAAQRGLDDDGALDDATADAWRCALLVHEQFPGDIGVVVLLTMVYRRLCPGESYFLAAGVLHTFIRGTAVEILANSDNVVRAGLTPKPIDVEELLAIVDVSAEVVPESPQVEGPLRTYNSRAEHFALHEIALEETGVSVPGEGAPRIVLALGPAEVRCGEEYLALGALEAAWIAAGDPCATASGSRGSRVFVATPGATSR